MPYKSDAQRRYFHAAAEKGEISKKTVEEYDKASKGKELPEKVSKKSGLDKLKEKAKKRLKDLGE